MMKISGIFCLAAAVLAAPLFGANLQVTDPDDGDPGSLRSVMAVADSNGEDDVITFSPALSGQTLELFLGPIVVTSTEGLVITAEALVSRVNISAFGGHRIFEVASGGSLELVDLAITEGSAPWGLTGVGGLLPGDGEEGGHGGAIHNQGTLVLRRCLFEANAAGFGGKGGNYSGPGGGVAGNGGKGGAGGAIFSLGAGASVMAEDCVFRQNDAGTGGAAGGLDPVNGGTSGMAGAGGSGGAIHCEGGRLELWGCLLESNRAGTGGTGTPPLAGGTGGAGGQGGNGGAIALSGTELVMVDTTIWSNSAGFGGAGGDNLMVSDDTPGAGGDGGDGGGAWLHLVGGSAVPQVRGSLFHANEAGSGRSGGSGPADPGSVGTDGGDGGDGGALYVSGTAATSWRMENSTVILNFAGDGGTGGNGSASGGAGGDGGKGGGVAFVREVDDYTARIVHVTLISNNAGLKGQGGLPAGPTGADSEGGGIWEDPAGINAAEGVVLANSVVTINDADVDANLGAFTAEGNNFTSGDPQVGPLSDNGGPTWTVPPLLGSPLLDGAGVLAEPLLVDQRGEARPFNLLPDLGAFEAKLQPDARIGSKASPTTHRIDDLYNATGAGQVVSVRPTGLKKAFFFVSIQNDGEIADPLVFTGTRANKTLRWNAVNLTLGGNVTAALATGLTLDPVDPGEVINFRFDVRARSAKRRARQNLFYSVRSSVPGPPDVVRANVLQRPPARRK